MSLLNKMLPAALLALQASAHAGALQDHPGFWLGAMTIPNGQVIRVGAEIFTRADGSAWASFASPDQGVFDAPVSAIVEKGDTLALDLSVATLSMTWAGDHFTGTFQQGPGKLPLELSKVAQFPKKARPQTPHTPYPYSVETLAIPGADGVTLGATLSIPNGNAHPNVVVLVHGSGPGTRDEGIAGHESFAVLADYLARQGVAVLRYDKRGVSRSTGDYEHHTQPQLANDVAAVLQALRARKQFRQVGLIGLSEGPGIAAAVAAKHPESVDFIVSLAGIGLAGLDVMLLQDSVAAHDGGATAQELPRLMDYVRKYYTIVMTEPDVATRIAALKALQAGLPRADQSAIERVKMNEGTLSLDWAAKPFLPVLLNSDPRVDWRAVRCPVLALGGSVDHQVPAEQNVAGIRAALTAGGNTHIESAILPGLNHLFQRAKTGAEDEYANIDETMAPAVLQRVASFALKQK